MRVSTSQIFERGAASISRQQADWLRTQTQLSSGKRMLGAADDPIAAAQALRTEQARSVAEQYEANQSTANAGLALAESLLGEAGGALQDMRTMLVGAKNSILSDADRANLAIEFRSRAEQLLGVANTRDGNGEYVFAGYQSGTQPFSPTAAGAVYLGDEGERQLQVSDGRTIGVSVSGARVFDRVPDGNGTFRVTPGPNTGSAVHDGGAVTDVSLLTGHDYRIVFHVAGAATTYDVLDMTASTTLVSAAAWTSGQAIAVGGMQLGVQGAPAEGDRFDLSPSAGTNVFGTLASIAAVLATPSVDRAAFANAMTTGLLEIDQAIERALESRTSLGARLHDLESLGTLVSGQKLQYETELSALTDLDYAEAASRFSAQQTALEAAQRSYVMVTGLSLFDYL